MEQQQYLIVSDPPHGEVDFAQAGPVVGMAAVDFRMKANYPIPEIWLADTDESAVNDSAQALTARFDGRLLA